jgi:two-component sensor histidine kinase/PAS domain-containing protein
VVSETDISQSSLRGRQERRASEEAAQSAEGVILSIQLPVLALTDDLVVEAANPAFYRLFQVDAEQTLGRRLHELGNGQWNIPDLHWVLENVLTKTPKIEDYRIEHRFERIGQRALLVNAARMQRRGNSPPRVLLAISDITEHERLKYEIDSRAEFADKILNSIRESFLVLDRNLRVKMANQAFFDKFQVARMEVEGRLVYELGNGQWNIPALRRLLEDILPKRNSFDDFEAIHDFPQLGRRVMLLNARRIDHLELTLLAIQDITEEREADTHQRMLLGELQHRVKNMLLNVLALSRQTRAGSQTLDEFMIAFEGRISALARAQDLLLQGITDTALLGPLVRLELERLGAQEGRNFTLHGCAISLFPRVANVMAMTIHELATNAGKYGALSVPKGHIEIIWAAESRQDKNHLRFSWRERGVPQLDASSLRHKGFGTRIIENSIPHVLGGTSTLSFGRDGLTCEITFPLPEREDPSDPRRF